MYNNKRMIILLTGGLGFIGSHTAVTLGQDRNNTIIILDNLSNSTFEILKNIKTLVKNPENIYFVEGDVTDESILDEVFSTYSQIDAVIHFASLKSVSESIDTPLLYYRENLNGMLSLLEIMDKYNCLKFIFSSSATVYGSAALAPLKETDTIGLNITNPYGQTKYFQECILQDYAKINQNMKITILRYFNPVGAHPSGLIGENPKGIPTNLFPYLLRVVSGEYEQLNIYGQDYPTADGTCLRDFIHVMDLAEGHVVAMLNQKKGVVTYNLGTGTSTSVKKLVTTFEKVTNKKVPYVMCPRRNGDIGIVYADVSKVFEQLGWETSRTIEDICRDGYNFAIKANPI